MRRALTNEGGEEGEEGGTPVYDLSRHSWGMSEEWSFSTALLVFSSIFVVATVLSFYTSHVRQCTLFPEAGVVLLVGIVASGLTTIADPDGAVGSSLVNFDPTIFFVGLLPLLALAVAPEHVGADGVEAELLYVLALRRPVGQVDGLASTVGLRAQGRTSETR